MKTQLLSAGHPTKPRLAVRPSRTSRWPSRLRGEARLRARSGCSTCSRLTWPRSLPCCGLRRVRSKAEALTRPTHANPTTHTPAFLCSPRPRRVPDRARQRVLPRPSGLRRCLCGRRSVRGHVQGVDSCDPGGVAGGARGGRHDPERRHVRLPRAAVERGRLCSPWRT